MLEGEPTNQYRPMITGSGRNGLDLEKMYTVIISTGYSAIPERPRCRVR